MNPPQRSLYLAHGEVATVLLGVCAVVDDVAGEVGLPRGHHVEQHLLLHVDEGRQVLALHRHLAAAAAVGLAGDVVGVERLGLARLLDQRLVLILSPESGLILEIQIHGMLDGTDLVRVMALGPGHHGPLIHFLAMLSVECRLPPRHPPAAAEAQREGLWREPET